MPTYSTGVCGLGPWLPPGLAEQLREALQSTFGLVAGPPDRFLVALGVLTLLADAASDAPAQN